MKATADECPILFSGPMVRAILDGRKTQTRRIVKPRRDMHFGVLLAPHELAGEVNAGDYDNSPYGEPTGRLWVRETWQHSNYPLGPYDKSCHVFYRADYHDDPHGPDGELSPEGKYRTWRPSIHMPRSACRIVLEIRSMRIERLQAITPNDCIAEGAWKIEDRELGRGSAAVEAYRTLWEQLNGQGSWDTNPWVWVIEFRRVEPQQ